MKEDSEWAFSLMEFRKIQFLKSYAADAQFGFDFVVVLNPDSRKRSVATKRLGWNAVEARIGPELEAVPGQASVSRVLPCR